VAPVDIAKLAIDRQHHAIRVEFGHANQASVSEVSAVALDNALDGGNLLLEPESRTYDTTGDQLQDRLRSAMEAPYEVGCFGKYRLARQ